MSATTSAPIIPTPISSASAPHFRPEELRINAAYARRRVPAVADRYSWFNRANVAMIQSRERHALALLDKHGCRRLEHKRILEVGCGTGHWLRDLIRWGVRPENLAGIDLLPDSVAEARRRCPADVELRCASAAALPFAAESFDLVLQSTVFTSILDADLKRQVAREMLRVLRPDGLILWYDFHMNNPRNPDVRGVKRAEIQSLFGPYEVTLRRVTLAPPLTRLIAPCSLPLCWLLERIPWLCSHYLGVIRKLNADS